MIKSGERGFTVVELIMATAISGLVLTFLGTSVYQMLNVTEYGHNRLTALHELQNAAHWFNLDGQRAVSASADGALVLVISESTSITYSLAGTELRRSIDGNHMVLGHHIASASFSMENRVITMSLSSSPGGRDNVVASITYRVNLRPAEGGG